MRLSVRLCKTSVDHEDVVRGICYLTIVTTLFHCHPGWRDDLMLSSETHCRISELSPYLSLQMGHVRTVSAVILHAGICRQSLDVQSQQTPRDHVMPSSRLP